MFEDQTLWILFRNPFFIYLFVYKGFPTDSYIKRFYFHVLEMQYTEYLTFVINKNIIVIVIKLCAVRFIRIVLIKYNNITHWNLRQRKSAIKIAKTNN